MTIIGLGNEFRHDDAAGLIVARRLRECGVPALEHDGDFASLISRWEGTDGLILIDAVSSGVAPGTLHRIGVNATRLPREMFRNSTHALGLADAVELSRAMGTLPSRVLFFGVEARDFTASVGLSPDVERALPALVEEVLSCMKRH